MRARATWRIYKKKKQQQQQQQNNTYIERAFNWVFGVGGIQSFTFKEKHILFFNLREYS